MTNPVMQVRNQSRYGSGVPEGRGCWIWCPGCDKAHRPQIVGEDGSLPDGPTWDWDGNLEKPTFSPSLLVKWTTPRGYTSENPAPVGYEGPMEEHICHSFIRQGRWEFLSDSTHELSGQTVDMVPLPDWLVS